MKIKYELSVFERDHIKTACKKAFEAGREDIKGNYEYYPNLLFDSLRQLSNIFNEIQFKMDLVYIYEDYKDFTVYDSIETEYYQAGGIVHTRDLVNSLGKLKAIDTRKIEYKNLYKIANIIDCFYYLGLEYQSKGNQNLFSNDYNKAVENLKESVF